MQTYRVYGNKSDEYYVDVEAIDSDEAYDIAAELDTHKWFLLEEDNVIEPHTVELQDDLDNN